MYLDTVQLEKNSYSYTNRNKIKTPQGTQWLSVPLKSKGYRSKTIAEILIDDSQDWKRKHLRAIYLNYRRSINFDELYPKLEQVYRAEFEHFSDLAYHHLLFWLDELKIDTKIIKSSSMPIVSKKSGLILDLCEFVGATNYISGALGVDYLDEKSFSDKSIQIEYQDYSGPAYQQLHGEFIPNLAVLDFCMNSCEVELISGNPQRNG